MINELTVHIKGCLSKKKGQGLVEYTLIIGVIAMILLTLIGSIGKSVFEFISAAVQKITSV